MSANPRSYSLALLFVSLFAVPALPQGSAQSFKVLYTFHGSDGANPRPG